MDDNNMNPFDQNQGTNSYGQPQQSADPYAQNPYGQQQGANPYAQPQQSADPYAQNPYGQQQGMNPYAQPQQGANPYAQPQQGANPYAQPQQNANPYAPEPGVNPYSTSGGAPVPPKEPKKKMSGKMKALIFGGIGLAVLAVGVYFLLTLVIFPAKKTVKEAFNGSISTKALAERSLLSKELGADEIGNLISEKGGGIDVSLKVKKADNVPKLEGLTVKGNVAIDKSAKKLSGEGVLENGKNETIEAELFGDEEQTYVTVKDLMDGYMAINNKNIISAIKNSPLMEGHDLSFLSMIPDVSLDFFSTEKKSFEFKLSDEFWDNVKVSRSGSEKLTVDEASVSAKKYEVTIPKDYLQEKLGELLDKYMDAFTNSGAGNLLSGSGVSLDPATIKSMLKSMITDDVIVYVYLDDDKVVGLKTSGELHIVAYALQYNIDFISFVDDDESATSLDASVSIMGQKIGVTASIVSKKDDGKIRTEVKADMAAAGRDMLKLEYKQNYNTGDKSIRGTGTLSVQGKDTGSIDLEGSVSELEKGKALGITLDELKITADGKELEMEAAASMRTLDSGVTVKDRDSGKKVLNLATCTEEEADAFIPKDKLQKFKEKLASFFN